MLTACQSCAALFMASTAWNTSVAGVFHLEESDRGDSAEMGGSCLRWGRGEREGVSQDPRTVTVERVLMCVCVCVLIMCVCVCVCVCVRARVCEYVHTHVRTHVCSLCLCMCVYAVHTLVTAFRWYIVMGAYHPPKGENRRG